MSTVVLRPLHRVSLLESTLEAHHKYLNHIDTFSHCWREEVKKSC